MKALEPPILFPLRDELASQQALRVSGTLAPELGNYNMEYNSIGVRVEQLETIMLLILNIERFGICFTSPYVATSIGRFSGTCGEANI